MKLRIVAVDENGYTGRDHHPEPTDIGLVVTPVAMETYFDDMDGPLSFVVSRDNPDWHLEAPLLLKFPDQVYYMWTCLRPNGTLVELMSHEVVALNESRCGTHRDRDAIVFDQLGNALCDRCLAQSICHHCGHYNAPGTRPAYPDGMLTCGGCGMTEPPLNWGDEERKE